jgi:hypothetical protein
MIDPFTFYARMGSAAFDMAGTVQRTSEMLTASQAVITTRTAMMGAGARSPIEGDYAERGRMVPEKVEAFGKADTAIANDCWAMHSAIMGEAQRIGVMALSGRAPTVSELSALATRDANLALRTFEQASAMGAKGLHPIHASATANARRLKRAKA